MAPRVISIVAAVITNSAGQMLLVRKRGTGIFMQPGGKIEDGEEPLAALSRELMEEIYCGLIPESAHFIGNFSAPAANEENSIVQAQIYAVAIKGIPQNAAEIEEIIWLHPADAEHLNIAPLTREHIFPLLEPTAPETETSKGLDYVK